MNEDDDFRMKYKKIKKDDSDLRFQSKVYSTLNPLLDKSSDFMWPKSSEIDVSCLSRSVIHDIDKKLQISLPDPPKLKPTNNVQQVQISSNKLKRSKPGTPINDLGQQLQSQFMEDLIKRYSQNSIEKQKIDQAHIFQKEPTLIEETPIPKKPQQLKKKQLPRVKASEYDTQIEQENTKQIQQYKVVRGWKLFKIRKEAAKYQKYKSQEFKRFFKCYCPKFFIHLNEGTLDYVNKNDKAIKFRLILNPKTQVGPAKIYQDIYCMMASKCQQNQLFVSYKLTEYLDNKQKGIIFKKTIFLYNSTDKPIELFLILEIKQ